MKTDVIHVGNLCVKLYDITLIHGSLNVPLFHSWSQIYLNVEGAFLPQLHLQKKYLVTLLRDVSTSCTLDCSSMLFFVPRAWV